MEVRCVCICAGMMDCGTHDHGGNVFVDGKFARYSVDFVRAWLCACVSFGCCVYEI